MTERIGVLIRADSGPGVLHVLTGAIAGHEGDIASVDIVDEGERSHETRVYFEIDLPGAADPLRQARSEEHTSELQSHSDIVCRLLLEKKKTIDSVQTHRTDR